MSSTREESTGNDGRLLELVSLIYEAALDPSLWPAFFERLIDTIGREAAALFAIEPGEPLRSLATLSRFDPEGSALPAYLACSRAPNQPPFKPAESRIFTALAPHIRRALKISGQLVSNAASGELLDSLPVGVIFVDPDAHPIWWNRYAEDISRAKDGLIVSLEGLRIASRPQAKALDVLIREAARPEAEQIRDRATSLSRPSFRRPYAVLVSPLKRVFSPVGNPAAVVLVADPERKLPPGTDYRLACQFGLTPAEGRMAAAIACGKTVEEAAAELSIGIATARTHVRKILLKTGSSHQTDLVRTLLTSPFLVNTG